MFENWADAAGAPSWAGYGVQLVATFAVFGVLGPAVYAIQDGQLGPFVLAPLFVLYGLYVGGIPFLIAVLLIHASCRGIRDQRVHVLAFGVAGFALPGLVLGGFAALLGDLSARDEFLDLLPLLIAAGVSAAFGRYVVRPLVPSVRERRSQEAGR